MLSVLQMFKDLWTLVQSKPRCYLSKIFRFLQSFFRRNKHAFFCLETAAEWCGCNKRTIQRAFSKFKEWGWLTWQRQGYQSSLYFMPEELIGINLDDPALAKRSYSSVHTSVHVLGDTHNHESVQTVPRHSQKKEENDKPQPKQWEQLPHYLRIPLMAKVDFRKPGILAWLKTIPQVVAIEALDDCRWREKQPGGTTNPLGLLLSRLSKRMNKLKGKYG